LLSFLTVDFLTRVSKTNTFSLAKSAQTKTDFISGHFKLRLRLINVHEKREKKKKKYALTFVPLEEEICADVCAPRRSFFFCSFAKKKKRFVNILDCFCFSVSLVKIRHTHAIVYVVVVMVAVPIFSTNSDSVIIIIII